MSTKSPNKKSTDHITDPLLFSEIATPLLDAGNHVRFLAHGESMAPSIRNGDILEIAACTPTKLKFGDIAFYRTPAGNLRAHRFLGRRPRRSGNTLRVCGDSHAAQIEHVNPDELIGRVVAVEQYARTTVLGHLGPRITAVAVALFQLFRFFPGWLRRRAQFSSHPR